jgi:hypothetical protein
MTETEWVVCTDPAPMMEFLCGRATDRKLRLFAVACCRRLWHLLEDDPDREAVEVAEQYVDGNATGAELRGMEQAEPVDIFTAKNVVAHKHAYTAACNAWGFAILEDGGGRAVPGKALAGRPAEQSPYVTLLRDIFGPLPYRPIAIHPDILAWNDRLVVRLAQAIYEERRWGDMPLLGDALLDAGCDSDEILAHCRSGGEHVRGCWVVDLCLGRS